MDKSYKGLFHHHIAPKMWSIRQTTQCGAVVVGMKNPNFGGSKIEQQVYLELRGNNEMEKRRWYLNTIPNMTQVKNLPVLKVGDIFKISSTILSKSAQSDKFPTGLHRGIIKDAQKAVITDG